MESFKEEMYKVGDRVKIIQGYYKGKTGVVTKAYKDQGAGQPIEVFMKEISTSTTFDETEVITESLKEAQKIKVKSGKIGPWIKNFTGRTINFVLYYNNNTELKNALAKHNITNADIKQEPGTNEFDVTAKV